MLKSQKKAAEEAAKSKVISLEEFLEVEVRIVAIYPLFILYCIHLTARVR